MKSKSWWVFTAIFAGLIFYPSFFVSAKKAEKQEQNSPSPLPDRQAGSPLPLEGGEDKKVEGVKSPSNLMNSVQESLPVKKEIEAAAKSEDTTEAKGKKEAPKPPFWEFPPIINVSKWGTELRVVVEPNILMDRDQIPTIQSVKLQTEKGDFLGLKTYNASEIKRRAEFMIDPAVLKLTKIKITINSSLLGDWSKVVELKVTEKKEFSPYSQDAEAAKKEAVVEPAPKMEKKVKPTWWPW